MFRHILKLAIARSKFQQQQRKLGLSMTCGNKSNLNRQGKIMSKLFGQKLKGSKKRWYPAIDTTTTQSNTSSTSGSPFLKASQLSKPGGAGKNSTRRSVVLNKLFMEQISSLLATGEIAEAFLGRGLQLTRVKIAPDFASINVYWLGQGDPQTDEKLADDLSRCSGLLRHELSQLRVMGEVPRIRFIQDKTFANIEHVENLLKNMNLCKYTNEHSEQENEIDFQNQSENHIKQEFYGNRKTYETIANLDEYESLPPMRHDVFGLDHRSITLKILTKMRKTKQAWEAHSEREKSDEEIIQNQDLSLLKSVQQRIADANESSNLEFNKFLAQRRERKNTPERKKYRRSDEVLFGYNSEDIETDAIVSKALEDYLNQEDYLHDDNSEEKKP